MGMGIFKHSNVWIKPTLKSYLKRYPEMGRILRRYNENKLDGTEEFPELPKNDIPIQ